jgi:hypothetical protein
VVDRTVWNDEDPHSAIRYLTKRETGEVVAAAQASR